MLIRDYRDLIAWQRSLDLIEEVYRLTQSFPRSEQFGLTSQMRRASVSVSSNLAEGSGRATTLDLLNFLSHSRGSVKETESLVFVSERLRFATAGECQRALELTDEVARLVSGLRSSVSASNKRPTRRK
jgi:four helix bundle protein